LEEISKSRHQISNIFYQQFWLYCSEKSDKN